MARVFVLSILGFSLILPIAAKAQEPPQPSAPPREQTGRQSSEGEHGRGLLGKITAIQEDSIEISRPDGSTVKVKLTDQTQFRKDRQPAKLADFKVGDIIFVRGEVNPDFTWTAQLVGSRNMSGPGGQAGGPMGTMGKDFVLGEVKEIQPPKITVLRPDNVTQTLELNEETSLRKGQESITLADLQPGDHIFAHGAVENDVFVPKTVFVATPEQWKRMQEMGHFGPPGTQRQKSDSNPPKPPEPHR